MHPCFPGYLTETSLPLPLDLIKKCPCTPASPKAWLKRGALVPDWKGPTPASLKAWLKRGDPCFPGYHTENGSPLSLDTWLNSAHPPLLPWRPDWKWAHPCFPEDLTEKGLTLSDWKWPTSASLEPDWKWLTPASLGDLTEKHYNLKVFLNFTFSCDFSIFVKVSVVKDIATHNPMLENPDRDPR